MSVKISKTSTLLEVAFDYSPERIRKVKSVPGYKWVPERKVWTVPFNEENLQLLKTLFRGEQILIDFEENEKNSAILRLMEDELKLKGYSFKTKKSYIKNIKRFMSYIDKDPGSISNEDIRSYVLFLLDKQQVSHSYANQAVSAIKFLYNEVLKMGNITCNIPRAKRQNKLPDVLSFEEVSKILTSLTNEKHKTILFLIYSAGLRVGEV